MYCHNTYFLFLATQKQFNKHTFIHLGERINYYSTKKIESDGIHTEWNQNSKGDINLMPNFQFKVKMPSLAFLEIEVKDGYFGDLGIFCSPITMIKEHGKKFVNTGHSLKQ